MGKRLFLLITPIVLLLVALIILFYKLDHQRIVTSLESREIETLSMAQQSISHELELIVSDLSYLSQQASARAALQVTAASPVEKDLEADYSHFIATHPQYTQIRLIDSSGQEQVRVDFIGGRVLVSPHDALQDKSSRYYFKQAIKLAPGQVYISPFDLNIEHGVIETPINPTIRFATPIYGQHNKKLLGLLIFNYAGDRLLKQLGNLEFQSHRSIWLVNKNGYFLRGPNSQVEWGFMYADRHNATLAQLFPKLAGAINKSSHEQIILNNQLYSYIHLCDQAVCNKTNDTQVIDLKLPTLSNDFPWVLISHLDLNNLTGWQTVKEHWYWLYGLMLTLLALGLVSGYAIWQLATTIKSLEKTRAEADHNAQLIKTFIDSTPALVYIKDAKGYYQIANEAYAEFVGKSPEQIIGHSDFDFEGIQHDDLNQRSFQEQIVLHKGTLLINEECWYDHEHTSRNYVVTRFPVREVNGEIQLIGVIAVDVTERDQAKAEMADKQAMFSVLVNSSPDAIMMVNAAGEITFANMQCSQIFGWGEDELIGMRVESLMAEQHKSKHVDLREQYMQSPLARKMGKNQMVSALRKDQRIVDVDITLSPVMVNNQSMTMCIIRDITKRLKMENAFRHSQKMEAIGHLTGGIAHDFNNMLGIIIGNLDLLRMIVGNDSKAERRIEIALQSAMNGADLTKRLLAFARQQPLNAEPVEINAALQEMLPIIKQTLKNKIQLLLQLDKGQYWASIDLSEFTNVILNLAINARDAMPDGGKLTIEVRETFLDSEFLETYNEDLEAGNFIEIIISDTGQGIPKDVLPNIFEPFYTTKEKGKGTGLGLSMTHGFVKQSNGIIRVYSEQGLGTTFHIYLPTLADKIDSQYKPKVSLDSPTGSERILVVDDEHELADIASAYLTSLGYQVETAYSAQEALTILNTDHAFDLVLTDIVMPGELDGIALSHTIHRQYPDIKIVYASGYSSEAFRSKDGKTLEGKLINKPYRKNELARALREVLDE